MKDYRKYKLGALSSPFDERDYKLTDLLSCAGITPDEYVNPLVSNIEIVDQGYSEECVACSLAYLRWLTEYSQSNNEKRFSPTYLYANRDEDMYQGEGMYVREALKSLCNGGMCFYEDFPGFYSFTESKKKFDELKDTLYPKAYPYRISSYYSVRGKNEIKTAVLNLGGVLASYKVYDCMYEPDENGYINYDSSDDESYGNHAMTIIGWTDDCWIVLNSWGIDYGKNGLCYIPFDYPIKEAWAVVDEITEVYFKMTNFLDIQCHWAENDIEKASNKGIVNGYDDGTFRPDEGITRAQLCVILNRLGLLD